MDYEKKYKEALDRAKSMYESSDEAELAAYIFPELRESEDERIRKKMIEHFKSKTKDTWCNMPVKSILNWLEKQKEQKSIEWKPQPESLEALMYAIEGKWDMIPPTSYLSRRLEDLYKGLVNTFNVDESLLVELPKVASRAYTAEDIEELRELKHKIDASMEQKPIQSDDEREYVKTLKGLVSDFVRDCGGSITDVGYYQRICDWLDGRHIEQKPTEWSEEDEKMIERLITRLNWITYNTRTDGTSPNITFFDEIAWLKSLRPQPKREWSKEDWELLQEIRDYEMSLIGDKPDFSPNKVREGIVELIDRLMTKQPPRPSWKPSEEQMKALQNAVALTACDKELARLYDDLKKLM